MALRNPDGIRLVAFDLDGTLIDQTIFIWKTLHEHFGSDPKRRATARDDYLAGRISYAEWFRTDLVLLGERGADRDAILACFDGLTPAPGAIETLETLKARGYKLGLISGSLDVLLQHLLPLHPFDHVLINRLHFAPDGTIAGGEPTPYDMQGKANGLAELARREGIDLPACAFVGDNVNDLHVMGAAGYSIGVHVKHPDVRTVIDHELAGQDLRPLLKLFPPLG
jgi:phosphoserine phosphatase